MRWEGCVGYRRERYVGFLGKRLVKGSCGDKVAGIILEQRASRGGMGAGVGVCGEEFF